MVSSDTFTFSLSPSEQNHSLCMCDDYGRMCGRIHISFPILNCCLVCWLEGCTSGRFVEMLFCYNYVHIRFLLCMHLPRIIFQNECTLYLSEVCTFT